MPKRPEVLALIPAWSDARRDFGIHVRPFRGKPLLVHSALQALAAQTVSRVVVSTDSFECHNLARAFGAQSLFSQDQAPAGQRPSELEVFDQALRWLDEHESYRPQLCVQLRPTFPHRSPADIDGAVRLLIDNPEAESVRSLALQLPDLRTSWYLGEDGFLRAIGAAKPTPRENRSGAHSPAQRLVENGAVNVVRTDVILSGRSMTGNRTLAYVMSSANEIDDLLDFERVECAFLRASEPPTGLTFVFDLDGVIATLVPKNRYETASPEKRVIEVINRLYDAGNRIVVCTARGSATGVDWRAETEKQLLEWGLLHHELRFGKPAGDFYVDDRGLSIASLLSWLGAAP